MGVAEKLMLVLPAILIGLVAILPGWRLVHRAYFTSDGWQRWLIVLGAIVISPLVAIALFYLPFVIDRGSEVTEQTMFIDFIIYAVCPAGILAFAGYVSDFLSDGHRPGRLLASASACFALAMLFPMYFCYSERAMARFEIHVDESESQPNAASDSPSNVASPE